MDNITLNKTTYNIKNKWEEFSISNYFDILELLKSDILTPDEQYANILAIAMNKTISEVEDMSINHYMALIKSLKFLENTNIDSIKIPNSIEIGGKLYKININIKDFTTEMYLNINHHMSNTSESERLTNIIANIILPAKQIKSFYGKKLVNLTDFDMEEHTKFIGNNINIILANSIIVFFYQVMKVLTLSSITSLENQVKRTKMRLKLKKKLGIIKAKELLGLDALITLQEQLEEVGKKYID